MRILAVSGRMMRASGNVPARSFSRNSRPLIDTCLMKANQLDETAVAADYHLPVEAVREALVYVERNRELLETEAEIERLMLKRRDVSHSGAVKWP